MRSGAPPRLCSLLLAVAMVATGVLGDAPWQAACRRCAPSCPMHAKPLGCHHGARPSCHHGGVPAGLRGACGHRADPGVQPVAMRALLRAPATVGRVVIAERLAAPEVQPDLGVAPEPPTEPPRASAVG